MVVTVPVLQPQAGMLLGVPTWIPPHAPVMRGTTIRAKSLVQSSCRRHLEAQAKDCRKPEDEVASWRCLAQTPQPSPSLGTPVAAAVELLLSDSSWDRGGDRGSAAPNL